jgi:N-acetylglucosaminyldiphosphoundecaprenol N-acetyl-beta-D-mannosaminyltransferase
LTTDTLSISPSHVSLFGLTFDALDLNQAAEKLHTWICESGTKCRYVVTPNVDHLVLLQRNSAFQEAYRDAAMVVADGLPLVQASRWLGKPLPERVAGSDLVPAVFSQATQKRPLRTFLLGAAPGVAERAARNIQLRWPHVQVVDTYSPPLGFEQDEEENGQILTRIEAVKPDLLVIGLGAPKQELWIHRQADQVSASVAVCAGATIDFLAGEKQRAPRWVQRIGLEWCHRMLCDPRRLVKRYAVDAWVFPQLLWREISGQPVA